MNIVHLLVTLCGIAGSVAVLFFPFALGLKAIDIPTHGTILLVTFLIPLGIGARGAARGYSRWMGVVSLLSFLVAGMTARERRPVRGVHRHDRGAAGDDRTGQAQLDSLHVALAGAAVAPVLRHLAAEAVTDGTAPLQRLLLGAPPIEMSCFRLTSIAALGVLLVCSRADASPWKGVAASSRGDVVMVWSDEQVVARVGDERFAPVSVGGGPILDVRLAADGSFAVTLGEEWPLALELHRRRLPTVRLASPLVPFGTEMLQRYDADEGGLALVFVDRLERREWDGRLLATIALPPACEECPQELGAGDLDLTAHGVIRLTDTMMNTCTSVDFLDWQRVVRVDRGATKATTTTIALAPEDLAATWQIGAHGWLYGISYADRLLARGGGAAQVVRGVAIDGEREFLVAHNERVTVAAVDTAIWRLDGARERLLARAPARPVALALDARTRPPVLVEADKAVKLFRFERARGWVQLQLPE